MDLIKISKTFGALCLLVLAVGVMPAAAQKREGQLSFWSGFNARSAGDLGYAKKFTPSFGVDAEIPVTKRISIPGEVQHDLSSKRDTRATITTVSAGVNVKVAEQGDASFYVGTQFEEISLDGQQYSKREAGVKSYGDLRVRSKHAALRMQIGARWASFASKEVPYASATKYVGGRIEVGYLPTRHVEILGGWDFKNISFHVPSNIIAHGTGMKGIVFGGVRFFFDMNK